MDLAELAEVQFGTRRAWRVLDRYRGTVPSAHAPSTCTDPADHLVLTLRQLLEVATTAGRPVGLAIETKHPTRYRGDVETALVALLGEFGLLRPARDRPPAAVGAQLGTRPTVRVMSFAAVSLRRMRRLAPELDLVLLMGRIPPHLRNGSLPEGVRAAGIDIKNVRRHPEYLAKAHDLGNAVYCWTVNTPEDADACLAAGVDALITDRPAFLRSHVLGAHATGSA
jgi:glycerophosphoryl diester phosphodiesterase